MAKAKLNFHERLTLFGGLISCWIGIIAGNLTKNNILFYTFMIIAFLFGLSLFIRFILIDLKSKKAIKK